MENYLRESAIEHNGDLLLNQYESFLLPMTTGKISKTFKDFFQKPGPLPVETIGGSVLIPNETLPIFPKL